MVKKVIILIVLSLFLAVASIFAQNAQELRAGTFISGNLRPGQEIWYRVTPTEAGRLIVETTGSTDTYLEAFRITHGNEMDYITENDDGGEDFNARISLITTPGTTYMFLLRGFSSSTSGAYRIFASIEPMPPMTTLRVGTFHNASIVSGDDYWFSVTPAESGTLIVETSGSTDTYMFAYDENFDYLDEDDDGGEGLNARISIDVIAGRTYFFNVMGYSDSVHGPYRIMATVRPYPTPTQLRFGTFLSGNITSGGEHWYSVRTTSRGTIVVETTGSTDTYMFVYNENYQLIDQDDDGGEGLNARIVLFSEANQTYIFRVRGFSTSVTGPFRIIASFE